MLLRKPFPLWLGVSVFAVSVAMIPLGGQLRRGPTSQPSTMTELTVRLSQRTPSLHVVPQLPASLDSAIWVCTRPQSREQLWGLIRDSKRVQAGQWQGIVFCERMGESWVIDVEDEFIRNNWGECAMRIGPFVLFGDPDLLQRIRDEVFDYKSR
jgi:hypothetical protein